MEKNQAKLEAKKQKVSDTTKKDFFIDSEVKQSKKKLTPREVILSLLRAKNWKQVDLADKIGISRQGLNNYLRGYWNFHTHLKIKIAEAFDVDSSVIWDLEKNEN